MNNFQIANVDTDSISFCKEDRSFIPVDERKALIKEINRLSPEFMEWADDGYYKKVVILKAKNYVLQTEEGKTTFKGSAFKDQKKEPALRQFMKDIINEILTERFNYLEVYNRYVKEICTLRDISKWCSKKTLTLNVLQGTRTNETKVMDAIEDSEYVEGDKMYVFYLPDKSLCLLENFKGEYDKAKLLKRLHDTVKIFKNIIDIKQFSNYSLKSKTVQKQLEDLISEVEVRN
jgi:hypothetical protein